MYPSLWSTSNGESARSEKKNTPDVLTHPSHVGYHSVADSGGVRGVQMHPPLAASNVFLRT